MNGIEFIGSFAVAGLVLYVALDQWYAAQHRRAERLGHLEEHERRFAEYAERSLWLAEQDHELIIRGCSLESGEGSAGLVLAKVPRPPSIRLDQELDPILEPAAAPAPELFDRQGNRLISGQRGGPGTGRAVTRKIQQQRRAGRRQSAD